MAKIIGNTTTTPMAIPDWNQTDPTRADYIKNKPTILTEEDVTKIVAENGGDNGSLYSEIKSSILYLTQVGISHKVEITNNILILE